MAEPKSKLSRARRGARRSHDGIERSHHSNCVECGAIIRPHHVCSSCGYYKGKEVIRPKH